MVTVNTSACGSGGSRHGGKSLQQYSNGKAVQQVKYCGARRWKMQAQVGGNMCRRWRYVPQGGSGKVQQAQ